MEGTIRLRPSLRKFAIQMEIALRRNDRKGKTGWRMSGEPWLIGRVYEELSEMLEAINKEKPPKMIVREAADAANFLMMIADNYMEKVAK